MDDKLIDLNTLEKSDKKEFVKCYKPSTILYSRLELYADILLKWQSRINLVSNASIKNLWHRHFLDSIQLFELIDKNKHTLVDLGSGAGFPGLVLALMFLECGGPKVHLIEVNKRKADFLHEVTDLLGVDVIVHSKRIERIEMFKADLITSRALAPLDRLIGLSQKFLKSDSVCLFHKGEKYKEELLMAKKHWSMKVDPIISITSDKSRILKISKVEKIV